MQERHLLPLSVTDYITRFSLELVILTIAGTGLIINFTLLNHANVAPVDQSVIFSFLKDNPKFNRTLLTSSDMTTISAESDGWIRKAVAQTTSGIVLTSSSINQGSAPDATTIQADVIVKTNPSDTKTTGRIGLTKYTVQPGDTVIGVAASFGISPQTIMMENKLTTDSALKSGTDLTILPTTGITYTLKDGDTLESLLKKYKIPEDDFLDANNIESFEDLAVGSAVIIPLQNVTMPAQPKPASKFVTDTSNKIALKQAQAPDGFAGTAAEFIWPTTTHSITQGFSSRHTGIDISNSKMEPIFATADGFIEISGYQTNGYGNTIVINHGNGFKTRYGHASQLYVQAGDFVKQGQTIAKQGRTGRVRGATGIHLHFEIIKNGAKVSPLKYVKP